MRIRVFLSLLFLMSLVACKNNSEEKNHQEQVIKKNNLEVLLLYKTNKADMFKIMMNNIVVDEFQKKSIQFTEEVVPTSEYDEMKVSFDEGNLSKNIIFHLGNKVEKTVEIKSITITYGDKVFSLSKPSDFNDFLIFNKFIEIEPNKKMIKTKRIDGKLYPTFSLRQKLINQLK